MVLAGFAARHGLSDGIHQNLRTHCLVIKDEAGLQDPQKEEFQIDIAFSVGEFDFFGGND